ncbi:19980_t:CDS:2 [Entrophospora sp. SA101]|nr:19980_t:CDS:2 [Entrophospora sp. SA101]CAJ0852077.1 21286_t:CDS:2 [Entrophospora sp. SA101]CAJ0903922.1 7868_t:CDS:2 [Entrophospora sp. SA101]
MISQAANRSIRRKRNINLKLDHSPVVQNQTTPDTNGEIVNVRDGLAQRLTDLEIGLEFRLDLKEEDLVQLKELGAGNGGTVSQVMHITTKTVMAKKIIHIDANPNIRKQLHRELQILNDCNSRYIVSFYGAFMTDTDVSMCMEFMDAGSLDNIYKKVGPIPLDILGKITIAVLEGLNYLYESHRIIHRDVKPSNILVNSKGQIKICDFGVSGQLVNSIADTFVGTSNYMSPERIQGAKYSVRSDVWSVGITLMELALGRFPFPPDGSQLTVLELLQHIVNEPAPRLPQGQFPEDIDDLVQKCLIKDVNVRPAPIDLLKHPYVKASAESKS